MTRRLLPILLLLSACGDRGPLATEEGTRVTTEAAEIELGRAFPVEVVRTRKKQTAADPWSAAALLPLAVREKEFARRENDTHVEETFRYAAYAFTLGDVRVGDKTVKVRRALDPDKPGAAELPEPIETPFPWLPVLGGLGALALAVYLYRRRKPAVAPARPPPPQPEPPAPRDVALERLAALRGADLDTQPFYVEATELVRDYIGARFDVPALNMTTPELAAAAPAPVDTLRHCDLVKFARGSARRDETLDALQRFIEENA